MRRYTPLFLALTAAVILSNVSSAVTVTTTDPVGFTTTSLLGGAQATDTYVSIPFLRPPEFIGGVSGTTVNTITVAGTPWAASQFVYGSNGGAQHNHYYVLIGPCTVNPPREGHTYAITANTNNTLTVTTTVGDDVNGIPANTQITIIPNWTPATVFPDSDANVSFTPTASPAPYQTLIRVPNSSGPGYAAEYYFSSNAWQRVAPAGNGDDDALLPDSYFVVRNDNGAPTLPLTSLGAVLLKKLAVPLVQTNQALDNAVSLLRPLDVALNATGLGPPAFASGDQLLLFNNAVSGIDKSPSATYYYDTHWRLSGDATNADRGADVIPTGTGFLVRKAAGVNGTAFWTNPFPVTALSAVSRKSHGGVPNSPFDIPLPLSGTPGVECRTQGGTPAGLGVDYQIIFTFPTAVTINTATGTQGAYVTSGIGSVVSTTGSSTTGATTVTVNLNGVTTTAQRLTVTLFGVSDATNTNDVAVRMGILWGDTGGDGVVNAADITQTRRQSGNVAHGDPNANFRTDVTGDGVVNAADITAVRRQSGNALPPP